MTEPSEFYGVAMTLKGFAKMIGIDFPARDQSDKNPSCGYAAGGFDCLNAASSMCDGCDWWERVSSEYDDPDERRDEDNGEDDV